MWTNARFGSKALTYNRSSNVHFLPHRNEFCSSITKSKWKFIWTCCFHFCQEPWSILAKAERSLFPSKPNKENDCEECINSPPRVVKKNGMRLIFYFTLFKFLMIVFSRGPHGKVIPRVVMLRHWSPFLKLRTKKSCIITTACPTIQSEENCKRMLNTKEEEKKWREQFPELSFYQTFLYKWRRRIMLSPNK